MSLETSDVEINIKSEVKIEADSQPTFTQPVPVSLFKEPMVVPPNLLKEQRVIQQNAILFRTFMDCLKNTLSFTAKTEPFSSLLIPDPFTLQAFIRQQKEYELFAKEKKMNPYINLFSSFPLLPPTHFPVKCVETKSLASTAESESIIKTEENSETNQTCVCPKKPGKAKKVPKKKAQNRIKNIPGLVIQRVRSSIKNYYALNPKLDKHSKRLYYVEKTLGTLSKAEKEKLLAFLDGYLKNWKTWNTIQKYMETDLKYGGILLDAVVLFFGEEGQEDFNDWLVSGKMSEKSKVAVLDLKERIKIKFSKILSKEDDEEEPIEPRKIIKKEESS